MKGVRIMASDALLQERGVQSNILPRRTPLRMSALLLFTGVLVSIVAGILHPSREVPNNHPAVFAEYAGSSSWIAVHLGQFVGMVFLTAGLLTLFFALQASTHTSGWAGRYGAISAIVALALYGVLQAVDGVALKHAVDSWASAPEPEKAIRFAGAETMRWLEWATRSYHSFMLGLTFLLFGIEIASTGRISRLVGYLFGLSGLAYIAQGWVVGNEGFSADNTIPSLLSSILIIVWSIWLIIIALRMKETSQVPVE